MSDSLKTKRTNNDGFTFFDQYEVNGKIKIKAEYLYNSALFRISACEQNYIDTIIRGTVSAMGANGKVLTVKGKDGKPKRISKTIRCKSMSEDDIKKEIMDAVSCLYIKHMYLIERNMEKASTPETATLQYLANRYAEAYVAKKHSSAGESTQRRYVNALLKIVYRMPTIPMADFTEIRIDIELKKIGVMDRWRIQELHDFWEYCLARNACSGGNPVIVPPRKGKRKKKNVDKIDFLTPAQQDEVFSDIYEMNNGPMMGMALMLGGGFAAKQAVGFLWEDVVFHKEPDYVSLYVYNSETSEATHDRTRPIMPMAAEALTKRYNMLCKRYGKTKAKKMPVVSLIKDPAKACSVEYLNEYTKEYLLKHYFTREQYQAIGSEDLDFAASGRILVKSYVNTLIDICNLASEPGTLAFLTGRSLLNDTTSDNYRSYTCEPGQDFLYTIIRARRRNTEVAEVPKVTLPDGKAKMTASPRREREYFTVYGEYTLAPNESLVIKCPHGVNGVAFVKKDADNKDLQK